jgi:hypothetical protein
MAPANEPDVTRLWRAEAMLRHDRRGALAELERCFVSAEASGGLEGPLDGRLVTGTLGYGLDVVLEGMSRLWMPWKGKAFEAEAKQGRNRFAGGARPMFRVLWPGYGDLLEDGSGGFTAFPFDTGVGESVTAPGLSVLKIDYDHPASPWPVRLILDELVHVGHGEHLGQALMRRRDGFRRVAWFALGER